MEIIIDARNKKLGRLASEVASLLQSKHLPGYNPRLEGEVRVTVKNIGAMIMTGRKREQKIYYKHTGPLGHLKERKLKDVLEKSPKWVLRHAVNLMLPKNKLRARRIKRLIVE